MNIFDLLESPGMGRPRDTKGIQSAADQSAASVIGSGTTKREDKKKPVTMMGKNIKEGFDLGGVKNWLLKLKQGLSTEAEETKAMFDTYVRYTQGQASEQEMNAANEQFKDLLRGLGMGTLAAMPGSVVTLPLVFKLAKKFNIELMPSAFKNDVEEAAVKANFKMPPESLQDKMYRQHQELRKQRGAPSAEEYKQRIAQKQKEIDDLKEAHPNQQMSIYNPDGPTYRQEKMPGYDVDDIFSRGTAVDYDPEAGDINSPEDHLDAAEKANLKKILKQYMDKLSPVERNVLMMRYYQDHTLESAGVILGVTPERVRQIEARAMRKIRQFDKGTTKDLLGMSQKRTDEGILDRAIPKMPKPRNPADQVLRGKVNAGGRHLDKKRRQELAPKHKHQDPLEEGWKDAVAGAALAGSIALGGAAHAGEPVIGMGQSQNMQMAVDMAKHNARVKYLKTVHGDNFQDKQMPEHRYGKLELKPNDKGGYVATVPLIVDAETQNESLRPGERHHFETDPVTGKRVYKGIRGDQYDAPQRAKDDPAARADQERKAHIAHDRGLTEQAVKITDYDTWSDGVKALGGEIHPQKDRNLLVAQSWDGEEIGKFHLGKSMGFINQSGELDETIRKMGSQYRLLSKKGKNLGTFDSKAGAEKHEREVQYFKHKNMEEDTLAEDIESHLYLMSRAGYDIVQEAWSDKYKDSINCSDPKGFSQKAHCAGKKKNEEVSEEKVRLDPKCWSGKKIGNPKTKMKGGVRVNNCVPK